MTHSEWLVGRGFDEATLAPDRAAQLRNFYFHDQEERKIRDVLRPVDQVGEALAVGDEVVIRFRVTNVHPVIDPRTGMYSQSQTVLNLDRIERDGTEKHTISVPSSYVLKAQVCLVPEPAVPAPTVPEPTVPEPEAV